jgi:hypothetical protein
MSLAYEQYSGIAGGLWRHQDVSRQVLCISSKDRQRLIAGTLLIYTGPPIGSKYKRKKKTEVGRLQDIPPPPPLPM